MGRIYEGVDGLTHVDQTDPSMDYATVTWTVYCKRCSVPVKDDFAPYQYKVCDECQPDILNKAASYGGSALEVRDRLAALLKEWL